MTRRSFSVAKDLLTKKSPRATDRNQFTSHTTRAWLWKQKISMEPTMYKLSVSEVDLSLTTSILARWIAAVSPVCTSFKRATIASTLRWTVTVGANPSTSCKPTSMASTSRLTPAPMGTATPCLSARTTWALRAKRSMGSLPTVPVPRSSTRTSLSLSRRLLSPTRNTRKSGSWEPPGLRKTNPWSSRQIAETTLKTWAILLRWAVHWSCLTGTTDEERGRTLSAQANALNLPGPALTLWPSSAISN